MITVAAGDVFTDIDAYASALAYADLLRLQGNPARVVLEGEFNYSIPDELRHLDVNYDKTYRPIGDESFVVVDVSDPENMARFVDEDRVDEVIDHHPGMEQYWHKKIGTRSDIEPVGAACTQIYERWLDADMSDKISVDCAQLLAAGILDNTLNFTAEITSERDRSAYANLAKIADLPDDWPAQYFSWCQRDVERNLSEAIRTDTKIMSFAGGPGELAVGQLAVWDGSGLTGYHQQIQSAMQSFGRPWLLNVMLIKQECNLIAADDSTLQEFIGALLGVEFIDGIAQTNRLWLRKEIMQVAIDRVEGMSDEN